MHPLLTGLLVEDIQDRGEWSWSGRYGTAVRRADPCWACGKVRRRKLDRTIDHLEPQSRGGRRHGENIAGMCHKCNSAKSSYSIPVFLLRQLLIRRNGFTGRHVERKLNRLLKKAA